MRWTLWWFAVFAAYVIEFVTQTASEIVAGAIIGLLCTIVIVALLRDAQPGIQVRWRWIRYLAAIPVRMARDALLVSSRIIWSLRTGTELTGYLTRVPYENPARDDPFGVGREALVVAGVCAAPNTMVAEVDPRGTLLVHQLVHAPIPARSPEWPL